jgi:hypothetical protein
LTIDYAVVLPREAAGEFEARAELLCRDLAIAAGQMKVRGKIYASEVRIILAAMAAMQQTLEEGLEALARPPRPRGEAGNG